MRAPAWKENSLPGQVMHAAGMHLDKIAIKDGYGTVISYKGLRVRLLVISGAIAPFLRPVLFNDGLRSTSSTGGRPGPRQEPGTVRSRAP